MKSKFPRFSPEWWEWMTMPEPNSGCVLWLGTVCERGYGRVAYRGASNAVLVHRIAYECANGPILKGRHVCHRCDTPSCVNPNHLFIGTQKDNMRDMFAKGRGRPQGVGPKRIELERSVAAPVATPELALGDSNASVGMVPVLHHIRTSPMVAGWRHVTGVPARRPTYAIVQVERPQNQGGEPSTLPDSRVAAVATVAASWQNQPVASSPRNAGATNG